MRGQSPASSSPANPITRLGLKITELADRVRRLEQRRTVTLGAWRLQQDQNGDLVATNTETGSTTTVAHRMS